MILQDDEIIDLIFPKNPEAADDFGDCLSQYEPIDLFYATAFHTEVLVMVNRILHPHMKVLRLVGKDDDGYFWEVELHHDTPAS